MSVIYKHILAVDPGTTHTGIVKAKVSLSGVVEIVDWAELEVPKKTPAPRRINSIITQIWDWATSPPRAKEIWTELFMPYGARRGAMWNMALTGAIIYLPATREDEDLVTYGVPPVTWKSWVQKNYDLPDTELLRVFGLMDKQLLEDLGRSPHIRDALLIALYSQYGEPDVEQVSPA